MGPIIMDAQQKQAAESARERRIVEQENIVFKHALDTGKISQAQYNQAMAAQNARLADTKGVPVTAQPSKATTDYLASVQFYGAAGYPQYGGIYAVPQGIGANQEIYKITEKTTVPATARAGYIPAKQKSLEIALGPKINYIMDVPAYLSFATFEPRKPTPEERQKLHERYLRGEDISAGAAIERGAMANLVLATGVVTPIVTAPSLAIAGVHIAAQATAIGVGEVFTGGKLSVSEAIGLAAIASGGVQIGQGVIRSPLVKGRVQSMVDASYEQQIRFNEAVLQGQVKGVTEVWTPTGWQKVAMKVTGAMPKGFAEQVNIARVTGGAGPMGLTEFQRIGSADDLFEFGFVPKSAMRVEMVRGPETAVAKPSGLPLYYGVGVEFLTEYEFLDLKHEVARAEMAQNDAWKAANQGIPESQLAYDYRGPLRIENYPVKMGYAKGKTVGGAWTPPYQQGPTGFTMKTLWGSKTTGPSAIGAEKGVGPITPAQALTVTMKPITATSLVTGLTTQFTAKSVFTSGYNPAVWQGTPFYASKGRAMVEEIIYPLSYPRSGLPHPSKLGEAFVLDIGKAQRQRGGLGQAMQGFLLISQRGLYTSILDVGQGARLGVNLGVNVGEMSRAMQEVGQYSTTGLITVPTTKDVFQTSVPPFNAKDLFGGFNLGAFSDFSAPSGGGRRRGPSAGIGRYKRVYPIVTGADFLKNILRQTKLTKRGGRRKK